MTQIEAFEVASYKVLIVMAEEGGFMTALPLLQETLREEQAMVTFLDETLPLIVKRYLALRSTRNRQPLMPQSAALEPAILSGILASICTGLATMIGAMPVLGMNHMSSHRQLALLAFAGGVMLAASVFSLILPGIAAAQAQGFSQMAAVLLVQCATLIGAVAMSLLGWVLPVPETVFDSQTEFGSNERIMNRQPCMPRASIQLERALELARFG